MIRIVLFCVGAVVISVWLTALVSVAAQHPWTVEFPAAKAPAVVGRCFGDDGLAYEELSDGTFRRWVVNPDYVMGDWFGWGYVDKSLEKRCCGK